MNLSCLVCSRIPCVVPFYRSETLSSSSLIGLLALSDVGVAVVLCTSFFLGLMLLRRSILAITCRLHVLREPADTLAVALAHDDGAHEDLHGADSLESDLALASCNTPRISIMSLFSTTVPSNSENLLVW